MSQPRPSYTVETLERYAHFHQHTFEAHTGYGLYFARKPAEG